MTHPKKKKKSRKKKITFFAKVSTDDNNADSDAEFVYSTDAQQATRCNVFSQGFVNQFDEMTKTY